jgi:hypothetical protein
MAGLAFEVEAGAAAAVEVDAAGVETVTVFVA